MVAESDNYEESIDHDIGNDFLIKMLSECLKFMTRLHVQGIIPVDNGRAMKSRQKFGAVLGKLQKMRIQDDDIIQALENLVSAESRSRPVGRGRSNPPQLDKDMSLDQVERLISDESLTKNELLDIAKHLGIAGAHNSLNRVALIEKLKIYIRNQRTHDGIARLAAREPQLPLSPPESQLSQREEAVESSKNSKEQPIQEPLTTNNPPLPLN